MNAKTVTLVARCAICFLLCSSVSRGSLIISGDWTGTPTPGLPGFLTYTITATSPVATDKLIGFDFSGGGGTYGVFGNFNQVNPFSLPTVFNDNNVVFPAVGKDPMQDTQFMVKSTDGLVITPTESATSLKAAFASWPAGVAAATNQWTFLQIVTASYFQARGTITVRNHLGQDRLELIVIPVPEPTSLALLLTVELMCGSTIRRRS